MELVFNNSELGGFGFDLEEILESHGEVEDTELGLSLGNRDSNDNLDSDLHFGFSQIAWDARRNEIQKQWANADQETELEGMTKPLVSNIPSESESENAIAFAPIDVFGSTQPAYLQSRR